MHFSRFFSYCGRKNDSVGFAHIFGESDSERQNNRSTMPVT